MEKDLQTGDKGLFTDANEEFQPEGSYRFMLNGNRETLTGELGSVSNERGNTATVLLPNDITDIHVIGSCLLPNNDTVLFISASLGTDPVDIIGLHKSNNTFEQLIRTNCLAFNKCDQIDCQFRVHRGCDTILYFTDEKTKYKSINISKLENYYDNTFAGDPNVVDGFGNYGWNCGLFYLNADVKVPDTFLTLVDSQGTLRVGSYEFFIRLLDSDLNATDWIQISNPVYISSPPRDVLNNYNNHGGYLGVGDLDGFYYTDKGISILFENIDTDYAFVQVGAAEKAGGTDTYTGGYVTNNIRIESSTLVYRFDNIRSPKLLVTDPTLFGVSSKKIGIVKAHAQAENRLLVANIEETVTDYVSFQRAANDIKVEYFTYNAISKADDICGVDFNWKFLATGDRAYGDTIDRNLTDYSDPWLCHYGKTYMRDEIYALGIVWVFIDGTESPVFHIPGRPMFDDVAGEGDPISYPVGGDWTPGMFVNEYVIDGFDYAGAVTALPLLHTHWDSWIRYKADSDNAYHKEVTDAGTISDDSAIQYGFNDTSLQIPSLIQSYSCCEWINNVQCDGDSSAPTWKVHNTAYQRGGIGTDFADASKYVFAFKDGTRGIPGYYDTGTKYPSTKDCDGIPIFPHDVIDNGLDPDTYVMHNVRHHRMPDCTLEPITGEIYIDADNGIPNDGDVPNMFAYQFKDAEKTIRLNTLGLIAHEVTAPVGFEDKISGYYIVRGDRAGNKTVIDKGWFNISDTTKGFVQEYEYPLGLPIPTDYFIEGDLTTPAQRTIEQNMWFLSYTLKNSIYDYSTGLIQAPSGIVPNKLTLNASFQNVFEFQSPKVRINEPSALQGDYINLEQTVFGDMFILGIPDEFTMNLEVGAPGFGKKFPMLADKVAPDNTTIFKAGLAVFLNRRRFPRVFSFAHSNGWIYTRVVPIQSGEYALYNTDSISSVVSNFTIDNDKLHQRSLLLLHQYNCKNKVSLNTNSLFATDRYTSITDVNYICDITLPFHYFYGAASYDYGKWDITTYLSADSTNGQPATPTPMLWLGYAMAGYSGTIGTNQDEANEWGTEAAAKYNSNTSSGFVPNHSPYMYYAALKKNIQPYGKLDSFTYIRTSGYVIPIDKTIQPISGGDCFITRFQADKFYYDTRPGEVADKDFSFAASLTVGYVESEVNAHIRHIGNGETYKVWPFNDIVDSYWTTPAKSFTFDDEGALIQEGAWDMKYNYRLDFSADAENKIYASLSDDYIYCSKCQESFPHTIRYSDSAGPDQIFDAYKNFQVNSTKEIPSDTGEITNMFIKESNVFVHTENNLWRINIAPQQLETGGDTIQVGQGNFLGLTPTKMFDAKEGMPRGGCISKYSGSFGEDSYYWVDVRGKSVFKLEQGATDISQVGMSRWFINNLPFFLDAQFLKLTGIEYPHVGTSCSKNIGFRGAYDPEHGRYILTKRDYRILDIDAVTLDPKIADPLAEYVIGNHYYDNMGFYTADSLNTLVEANFFDKEFAESKSWTISFSTGIKAWLSYHSYIPNWMYNNSDTFYSFLHTEDDYIWEHNYGDFQSYYGTKFDFIIDYIYKKDGYQEQSNDTIEYTSNVYLESIQNRDWINVPFVTISRLLVYNNDQISAEKQVLVDNLTPYLRMENNNEIVTAHKQRNFWRISKLRDQAVNRDLLTEPLFSSDWLLPQFSDYFTVGKGYIDRVLNPTAIDLNKSVYDIQRFTDKYFGVRMFFKPEENYKLILNILSGLKRLKI